MRTLLLSLKDTLQRRQKYLSLKASRLLKSPIKLALLVVGLSVIIFLGHSLASSLAIAYGKSVDRTVFWKVKADKIKHGDYVLVETNVDDIFAKGRLITKIVGCASGEVLEIRGDEYYCGENYLGRAKHQSRTGIQVNPFNPCGTFYCLYKIPENQYFVVGNHKDSYDSRYFGPVNADKIAAKLLPIW